MPSPQKQQPWTTPRAFTRFLLDLRLIVRAEETLHGRTRDIAEGGMSATVAGSIKIGGIVDLELQLPETIAPLKVKAVVRYHQGFQYGFKFVNITDQQREMIRRATSNLPLAP